MRGAVSSGRGAVSGRGRTAKAQVSLSVQAGATHREILNGALNLVSGRRSAKNRDACKARDDVNTFADPNIGVATAFGRKLCVWGGWGRFVVASRSHAVRTREAEF